MFIIFFFLFLEVFSPLPRPAPLKGKLLQNMFFNCLAVFYLPDHTQIESKISDSLACMHSAKFLFYPRVDNVLCSWSFS